MKLDLKNPVFWGFSEEGMVEFGEIARGAASRLELRCKSVRLFRSFLAVSKCRGVVWGFRFGADERPPSGIFAFHCAGVIVVSREMSLYSVPVSCCGTKISLFDKSGKDV